MRPTTDELIELLRSYAEIANYVCEINPICGDGFSECPYDDSRLRKCGLGKLNDRLHELGIEVTDDRT